MQYIISCDKCETQIAYTNCDIHWTSINGILIEILCPECKEAARFPSAVGYEAVAVRA